MATAVLQRAKIPGPSPGTSKARVQGESYEPSSSRYPQPTTAADVFGSPSVPEPPARSFHKFRASLEQSLRTATRSKKHPVPPVDEFATVNGNTKKGKEKEAHHTEDGAKDKDRLKMFRKVTFRRDSPPPPPIHDESRRGKDRVAGHTSYITPSMRQASMSSPALHLSSQALPSPKSQPAFNASSSSNTDGLVSPTRQRTRRVSLQSSSRGISGPSVLSARLEPKYGPPPVTRHKSTKSAPISIPSSPSSPSLATSNVHASRASPSPARPRGPPLSPYDTPSHRPLTPRSPSNAGGAASRTSSPSSPTRTRSPSANKVRVATPSRGIGMASSSTSHLPLSSSPSPTPRRPSIDSPRRSALEPPRRPSGETPRRPSIDTGGPRESPTLFRAESPPSSPVYLRSRTPSQRAYAQNRHYNISAGSLLLPSANPEDRELIRTATSMLCKELIKPAPHMMKSEQGIRDWEEVEYRTRSLVRLERIWGRSGVPNGSPAGSPQTLSAAGEERERRTFCEALRDGFVLCQLLNKLRASTVVRPDPKEDGFTRTSNVTKFLAACASYGLSYDDMFQRDDLIEGSSESLARVAQTIIALIKFVESPSPSRSKYMSGQNKSTNAGTRSPYGTLSGISASTPNLLPSPVSPSRKRWSPPTALETVRSYSPEDPSAKTVRRANGPNAQTTEGDGDELEVRPTAVPQIDKPPPPPKSPLRKQVSSKSQDPGGLFAWARNAASPITAFASSPQESNARDQAVKRSRQSMASSVLTATTLLSTAPSSLLDQGHTNLDNNYGTIRTVTTDMTSEAPSITRTEGNSIAEGLVWKGSPDIPRSPSKFRDRKSGELHNVDLSRVVEETDDSISKGSKGHEANRNVSPTRAAAVHLRKGKWPDDFLDAFERRKPQRSISPSSSTPETDAALSRASPVSISSPRKLAVVGVNRSNEEGLSQFPRRPGHRPRHTIDSPVLLPKESILRREASPDSSISPPRAMVRRHSTKPIVARSGSLAPRNSDSEARGDNETLVPFPSASTPGEEAVGAPPTSSGSSGGDTAGREDRPRLRGRFQSDVESSSARGRGRRGSQEEMGARPTRQRFESMVNLGASSNGASASDLLARDSIDGSSARSLVVKENGKTPIHFQLGNCIGRGQFGSVYRALNLNTGQMVAVKRIRLEGLKEEEVTQLMREVDLVKNLSHPSIVKYEGMGRDEDHLSIVLEYAENGSLAQTLRAFGKLNERLVASYVVKILEGLHYLHTSDVVHCDLKAANILTTKNGNVKLSDFGVSLNLRAMEREIKDVAGTPNWMAPEVIELKGASTKSDIWSLGCTVVELLTGRPPYSEIANSMSVMFRIVEDKMPPLPENCSELLQDFLKQCFQKNPGARPSAEMLCEHAWLKANWQELKDLRPQDSIPFLRRVSTDLQKTDVVRYLSQMDLPESPVSEGFVRGDAGKISPLGRRTSNLSVRPSPDNDISPREHTFVKTTFSKPMMCRVCLLNVKKSAVLCAQCSLISHAKCAINAPPTCDLRAQLLLYAQYAEKGNPSSVYSNPADLLGEPKRPGAMSDVPYVSHSASGRTETDTPPPPSPAGHPSESPPSAYRFMAAFKRSRSNLTPEPSPMSLSSGPQPPEPEDRVRPRKATLLQKRLQERYERPQSVMSDSTGADSLRSAATAAESSMSSRHRSQHSSGGRATKTPRFSGGLPVTTESEANQSSSQLASELSDNRTHTSTKVLNSLSPETRRHKKNTKSSGNCIMQ